MGQITRFDLGRIIKEYRTGCFFETGTFRGDGLAVAMRHPFTSAVSIEIVPSLAAAARARFAGDPRVTILNSDSVPALTTMLPGIRANCLFWLDAHFPGADAGMKDYDADENEDRRLPLFSELGVISELRDRHADVLIIDDLRIWEDGPFANGAVPEDARPRTGRNLQPVYELFGRSHLILKSYIDEGYLLLFPKKAYRRNHFRLSSLFRKSRPADDYYFSEAIL